MMSHYESRRVIISHTYAYLLANHLISALTGFATWLRSKPWFEMMEIHMKCIENAKCYRNIYLSTYLVRFHHDKQFSRTNYRVVVLSTVVEIIFFEKLIV